MVTDPRIGFIGSGAIAEAIIGGVIEAGLVRPEQIAVSDISAERLATLADRYGVITYADNESVARRSNIVFLTVKPHVVKQAVEDIKSALTPEALIVSVAAGIPLKYIENVLPVNPVVRVMPNTPVAVGAGMSAIALGSKASGAHGAAIRSMLDAVGKSVIVGEELMDAVTGLSGSGPAYVFVLIDALSDAGVRVGLPRQTANLLAAQTLFGAAKMVLETGGHPAVLRDGVTSPGGTSITGVHIMEQRGVRAALIDAVVAATEKSREMGQRK